MKKNYFRTCVYSAAYIIGSILIMVAFIQMLNRFHTLTTIHASGFYQWLQVISFHLGISLLFSAGHIKNLLTSKGKFELNIARLITVMIVLFLSLFARTVFQTPDFLIPLVSAYRTSPHGISVFHFVFWYNLIYAFGRKPAPTHSLDS